MILLKNIMKNKYFLLRHGQALSNVNNVISCWPEKGEFPLTEEGKKQIKKASEELSLKNIDYIYSSDILRTKQSAEIVSKKLGVDVLYDERLREYNVGIFNGKPIAEYSKNFSDQMKRFENKAEEGETYNDIKKRIKSFVDEKENKFEGKNILIISHQIPIIMFLGVIEGLSSQEIYEKYLISDRIKNGEIKYV